MTATASATNAFVLLLGPELHIYCAFNKTTYFALDRMTFCVKKHLFQLEDYGGPSV